MEKFVKTEHAHGFSLSGIVAKGVFMGETKIGFDVRDVSNGRSRVLARIDGDISEGFMVGRYVFSSRGFEFAKDALLNYRRGGVVFVDEAGPLELEGKGYADCIRTLIDSDVSRMYVSIRIECVGEFLKTFCTDRHVKIVGVKDFKDQ